MTFRRQLVAPTLALALFFEVGCTTKKPQLPAQAKAPPEIVQAPLPSEISEETPPSPPPAPPPQQAAQEPPKQPPPKRHKRKPVQTTPAQNATASSAPANNGSGSSPNASGSNTTVAAAHPPANPAAEAPPDTAIAANVSSAELTQQKQTTAQLLDSADKTLNGLNRTLSHDEEVSLTQARSYIAQSRKATSEGDFERAYNLATKAHLLSDALVKK